MVARIRPRQPRIIDPARLPSFARGSCLSSKFRPNDAQNVGQSAVHVCLEPNGSPQRTVTAKGAADLSKTHARLTRIIDAIYSLWLVSASALDHEHAHTSDRTGTSIAIQFAQ